MLRNLGFLIFYVVNKKIVKNITNVAKVVIKNQ